jgi:hypothetical protein
MTLNNGLDKLGEHMAVKKYLYREDQSVFDKVEAYKGTLAAHGIKCSTKDAITDLINKGYQAELDNPTKFDVQKPEPEFSPAPTEEPKE